MPLRAEVKNEEYCMKQLNVGFISFRIAGTDGVSLETMKWVEIFNRFNANSFFLSGELDTPPEVSMEAEEMHFQHPETKKLYEECFDKPRRSESLTAALHKKRELFKKQIYEFIRRFDIDILIPQNSLTIPLNVPLGMALTEVIAETGIPTIAHHHDFFWERKRFLRNCVWDYINASFPPHLPTIQHVVINSSAQNQLALRTGISSTLIPNVMDFETPPDPPDEYTKEVRKDLGVAPDELLILQPTRVVQRKGIEHAIELVARLGKKAKLIISHASGDEGYEYQQRVKDFAGLLDIDALFVQEIINEHRGTTAAGKKIYTLEDIYPYADLVTYPSLIEGFGNAFLEAIYFKKPILVNNYSIYSHDIKPKGFKVIEIDNFINDEAVEETRELLSDKKKIEEMTETNYSLALTHYSYRILETKLNDILTTFYGSNFL